jgi:SpoVK/Ycf46/Vps4 family AAA+-type ATPase
VPKSDSNWENLAVAFYVEDIRPMVWNDGAFDHLVYDEQAKDLVLSFVENHNKAKPMMGDVIMGKGEGLIILLSGPPGTGKTLTAEAGKQTHIRFSSISRWVM